MEPCPIDFAAIDKAAVGAGYELTGMEVEVVGTVVERTGKQMLELTNSDQVLELSGEPGSVENGRVVVVVSDWTTEDVRFQIKPELPAEPAAVVE